MNWIHDISKQEYKKYSQYGEEGFIRQILANVPAINKFFVDLGCGKDFWLSNTLFLSEQGYDGIWIDGEESVDERIHQEWITRDNVLDILKKYNCPYEFDLLSIDLDGNDLYVLNAVLFEYYPSVIVAEFNPNIPLGESLVMPYDENHTWGDDDYFGFSFTAGYVWAKENGYTVIYHNECNLFMVRADFVAGLDIPPFAFKHSQSHNKSNKHLITYPLK